MFRSYLIFFILIFSISFSTYSAENINLLIEEYKNLQKKTIALESDEAVKFANRLLMLKEKKSYQECMMNDEYSSSCDSLKNELKKIEEDRSNRFRQNNVFQEKIRLENHLKKRGSLELTNYLNFLNASYDAIFFEVDIKYGKSHFDLIPKNCTKHPIACQLDLRYKILTSTTIEKLNHYSDFAIKNLDNFIQKDPCEVMFFSSYATPINQKEIDGFEKLMFMLHENFFATRNKGTNEVYQSLRGPYLKTNVFQIKIKGENDEGRICTATHIKIEDRCSLVTNDHCIQGFTDPKITLLTGEENEPPGKSSRSIDIKIKRASAESELVLLAPPAYFDSQYCGRLLNTKILTPEEIKGEYKNITIAGFLKTGEVDIKFNLETDDDSLKNLKPSARLIPSGLKGVTSFVEFKYIDVGPGMSGGPLLDEKGNILGITTRYMPLEDTPWIIPISDVQNFIENKKIETNKNPKLFNLALYRSSAKPFMTGDNLPKKPGDNLPKKPGDNLPKKPGDNLPKKPGDNLPKKPSEESNNNFTGILEKFRDKGEGIIDFNDPQKRLLLAVKCDDHSPWEQIDGHDDYIHKCDDITKLKEENKIYADSSGKIPNKFQDEMLTLLQGDYSYTKSHKVGRKVIFEYAEDAIDQMKKLSSNLQKDEIKITKDQINLNFGKTDNIHFKIKNNSTGNIVLEKNGYEELVCTNQNITKMICQNDNESITISMINSKNKELKYRYARIKNNQVEYFYGSFFNKN